MNEENNLFSAEMHSNCKQMYLGNDLYVPNPLRQFCFGKNDYATSDRAIYWYNRQQTSHRNTQRQLRNHRHLMSYRYNGTPRWELAGRFAENRDYDTAVKAWLAPLHEVDRQGDTKKSFEAWFNALSASNLSRHRILAEKFCPTVLTAINRAKMKINDAEWRQPLFAQNGDYWYTSSPVAKYHFLHWSHKDPTKIAYAKDWRGVYSLLDPNCTDETNQFVITSLGKYLTKYFKSVLSEVEIRDIAARALHAAQPPQVFFAETQDEIVRAIAEGPTDSCMANGNYNDRTDYSWFSSPVHPATAYGSGDFLVAYTKNADGEINSRAVINKAKKHVARAYGDADALIPELAKLGYTQQRRALVGCRLLRIEFGSGKLVIPYVDAGTGSGGGALSADPTSDGNHLVLRESGQFNTYDGYNNKGWTYDKAQSECDYCGGGFADDELYYIDSADVSVCETCRDDNYTFAYGRRGQDFYPNDDVIYCETDGEYYVERYTTNHDVYQVETGRRQDRWYHVDDLCSTADGWALAGDCVELDRTNGDHEWALERDTVCTENSETVLECESFVCAVTDHTHFEDDRITIRHGHTSTPICIEAFELEPERFTVVFDTDTHLPRMLIDEADVGFCITDWDFSGDARSFSNVQYGDAVSASTLADQLLEVFEEHHVALEAA